MNSNPRPIQVLRWPDGGYSLIGFRHPLGVYSPVDIKFPSDLRGMNCDHCLLEMSECDALAAPEPF